jgi:site-specific recombinase XerD
MKNNITLKFYLYSFAKSSGQLPIYLRITYQRKKAELTTGLTCTLTKWNVDTQQSKDSVINLRLSEIRSKAYDLFLERLRHNQPISANLLKELLSGRQKPQIELISYFEKHIEEITLKAEIQKVSLNKYRQSLSSLREFILAKYQVTTFKLDEINYSFLNEYDLYLKSDKELHKNTINKYHSRLRTILFKALNEGYITKQPYSNFKLVNQKTERGYLTDQEITQLLKIDLTTNKSLEKVRDIFLFSIYTGIRFKDAQNLSLNNLFKEKKAQVIRFTQLKTNSTISIPLVNQAIQIIDKYKDLPERKVLKMLLPKISNQKINSYLKVIGDMANIQKNITHHMARHTFATTICLNNNMPMEDLSKLLGHSSIKTTSIYGKITENRLKSSINKLQKNINHE